MDFLGRFGFGPGSRVGGGGSPGSGHRIHGVHDVAQIVFAQRISFKGDFRRLDAHRADDDFVRQDRQGVHADFSEAHADGVGCLVAWRIADDEALDPGRAGDEANPNFGQGDGNLENLRPDGFHALFNEAVQKQHGSEDANDEENQGCDAGHHKVFFHGQNTYNDHRACASKKTGRRMG